MDASFAVGVFQQPHLPALRCRQGRYPLPIALGRGCVKTLLQLMDSAKFRRRSNARCAPQSSAKSLLVGASRHRQTERTCVFTQPRVESGHLLTTANQMGVDGSRFREGSPTRSPSPGGSLLAMSRRSRRSRPRWIGALAAQALAVQDQVRGLERELMAWYRASALARRIATVPRRLALLGATALAATVTDPGQFRSGREFAAWLGLTPRLNSSGGKERLGRISKMGDRYLRRLLIVGMTSLVRQAKRGPGTTDPRLAQLLARKPARVATVAMANRAASSDLGDHDPWLRLSRAAVGLSPTHRYSQRPCSALLRRLQERCEVMANRVRPVTRTPRSNVQGFFRARKAEWDLSSANHQGQRLTPRKQAGHKTASDPVANISRPLAMREPSTQDIGGQPVRRPFGDQLTRVSVDRAARRLKDRSPRLRSPHG